MHQLRIHPLINPRESYLGERRVSLQEYEATALSKPAQQHAKSAEKENEGQDIRLPGEALVQVEERVTLVLRVRVS
jgi:hypothetical protein